MEATRAAAAWAGWLLRCRLLRGGYGFTDWLRARPSRHLLAFGVDLAQLDERQFHQQAFVAAGAVVQVAVVAQLHGAVEERQGTLLGLLAIALADAGPHLQQRQSDGIFADQQVAEVRGEAGDEVAALEALAQHLVEQQEGVADAVLQQLVGQAEVVFVVQYVEVFDDALVGDAAAGEAHHLVEDGECVAHAAVGLQGDDVQGLGFGGDAFLGGDVGEVGHGVLHADALEVVDLAAGQDGGQDFVLLGSGEDEDGVVGRLLQRLEEGVEGGGGQHVHLVDDVDLVFAYLGRDAYLLHQLADVVHGVVGCGVQLVDVVRALFIEGDAGFARVACLAVGSGMQAVDGLGEDAGTGRLAHAARAAEEVGMGQLAGGNGILERRGQSTLADNRLEGGGAVFPRGYDIIFHKASVQITWMGCKCKQKNVISRLLGVSLWQEFI